MCDRFYGDVSIAVIVVLALVGDGVPFDIPDGLIDLVVRDFKGDFTLFGVWNRNSSVTVMDTWTTPFPSRTSAAQHIRFYKIGRKIH